MYKKEQITFAENLQKQGVTIFDENRIDFRLNSNDGKLSANHLLAEFAKNFIYGKNVIIDINTIFIGKVIIGDNVTIGANCILQDCEIASGAQINPYSYIVSSKIAADAVIGPFARLRPGTIIDESAHVGNFVEVKNSTIGKNSKANHLSYIGDADIGSKVNVGAGVITCNYDGVNKFRTIIEDDVFVGSDCQLVAPVTIGKGATIGAGTTLSQNAPAHKLTISRVSQKTIDKWQRPKKINK